MFLLNQNSNMLINLKIVAHLLQMINQKVSTPLVGFTYVQIGRYKDTYWSKLIKLKSR